MEKTDEAKPTEGLTSGTARRECGTRVIARGLAEPDLRTLRWAHLVRRNATDLDIVDLALRLEFLEAVRRRRTE